MRGFMCAAGTCIILIGRRNIHTRTHAEKINFLGRLDTEVSCPLLKKKENPPNSWHVVAKHTCVSVGDLDCLRSSSALKNCNCDTLASNRVKSSVLEAQCSCAGGACSACDKVIGDNK